MQLHGGELWLLKQALKQARACVTCTHCVHKLCMHTARTGEDEKRVFMSAVALGFNGRYNRLFTLTAQCLKKDLPRVGQDLQNVVASFTPPTPVV